MYIEVKCVLKGVNFNMRKWNTNSQNFQSQFGLKRLPQKFPYNKVLVYKWSTQHDLMNVELRNLLKYDDKNNSETKSEDLQMLGLMFYPIFF